MGVIVFPPLFGEFPAETAFGRALKRKAAVKRDLARSLGLAESANVNAESESALLDVERVDDGLEIRVHSQTLAQRTTTNEPFLLVEVVGSGQHKKLHVYSVPPAPARAKGELRLRSRMTDEIELTGIDSSLVSKTVAELEEGAFALLKPGLKDIVDVFIPKFKWTPLPVTVLQDGAAQRALVIPAGAGSISPLGAGTLTIYSLLSAFNGSTATPTRTIRTYALYGISAIMHSSVLCEVAFVYALQVLAFRLIPSSGICSTAHNPTTLLQSDLTHLKASVRGGGWEVSHRQKESLSFQDGGYVAGVPEHILIM